MVVRIWSARITEAQAPVYARHLEDHVFPSLHEIEGYLGAMLLERASVSGLEILVITQWKSLESIRAFAGIDLEHAVVSAEAAALLTAFDDRARHFHVIAKDRL